MSRIAVVTDSIACLPAEIQKKYGILMAPCYLIWDKQQYRDGVDMSSEEAYARLRTSKSVPTTSSAIQGEYVKIFEALQGKVDGIVVVAVTGGMGASNKSAITASELVPGTPVEVIDSRTAYLAQGFIAIAAAKVALEGGNLQQVVQAAQRAVPRVLSFFYVDTLEYIKKCGRVSLPQEVLDQWLKRRVMMTIKDGVLNPSPLTGNPQDQLMELLNQQISKAERVHIGITHGDIDPTDLKNRIQLKYNPIEILTSWVTPVAGVHVGPGTLGISFYIE